MDKLDPDDPRPPYQQVANSLRAAILTRRFQPGDKLPSGPELSKRYGVARMTVQQAIRVLRDEGLVVSRQGSGVYVRERTERPVGLRPHLERAFEAREVSVDFAGFSGETLHGAIAEPLDKIRAGRLRPESIRVRILVPDPAVPWTLPARVEDLEDSPAFRQRATQIMRRHTEAIVEAVTELGDLGLVEHAHAEIRVAPTVPLFKLYLINDTDAFFGFYPVQEHTVKLDGEQVPMWDLMGKDAVLFHHTADSDPDSMASQYVQQGRTWFDSLWTTVAREPTR
ncbi:GntR family transcriptional regulator [Pseudonocardia sp. H11422]|uniref:GntR family transcriptional regulator n=1 Tax=Pseudonocardia sp. H11422 TaxID=2835866 RepID=UPI001BDC7D59|nr:GntR family transcriptional regulator [Pseudonocardia sp. H11422]